MIFLLFKRLIVIGQPNTAYNTITIFFCTAEDEVISGKGLWLLKFPRRIHHWAGVPSGWLIFQTSPLGTSLPSGNMPSGNPPLGGCSLRLVNKDKSPSTGTSRPSGKSQEQLHEDERLEAMTLKKKNARLESRLAKLEAELMQANNKLDRLEAASELKDEQLRAALEHGDRPRTTTEGQKKKMLEAAIAQAQEEIQNQKVGFELQLQEKHAQLQRKDEIIRYKRNMVNELVQAIKEGGFRAVTSSDHDTGLRDFTYALLRKFHTVIAVGENFTNHHEAGIGILRSAVDQLDSAVEQANDRAKSIVEEARTAYDSGLISHEYMIETEELYHSEAEVIISMRETVAKYVKEDEGSIAELKEVNASAWRKYGRIMTNLGFTTQNVDITSRASPDTDSADIKQVSNSESGDMQQEKAKAADAYELARREIDTPPIPKPNKTKKSPAELEMLRLKSRQTLHCLNP